jgi:hypothetical protein
MHYKNEKYFLTSFYFVKMSDVSCVIFYAGKMLQTIEFPYVALNINLFEGPLLGGRASWEVSVNFKDIYSNS